jgi:hypothetical protein
LAIGSALALTVAGLSSPVMAQRHMHFGHFGGGFHRHFGGFRGGLAFGFAGPVWGGSGGCSTVHRVWTPFGWRWHRVWVC